MRIMARFPCYRDRCFRVRLAPWAHLIADRGRALDGSIERQASDVPFAFLLDAEVRLNFGGAEDGLAAHFDAVALTELRQDVRQFVSLKVRVIDACRR